MKGEDTASGGFPYFPLFPFMHSLWIGKRRGQSPGDEWAGRGMIWHVLRGEGLKVGKKKPQRGGSWGREAQSVLPGGQSCWQTYMELGEGSNLGSSWRELLAAGKESAMAGWGLEAACVSLKEKNQLCTLMKSGWEVS